MPDIPLEPAVTEAILPPPIAAPVDDSASESGSDTGSEGSESGSDTGSEVVVETVANGVEDLNHQLANAGHNIRIVRLDHLPVGVHAPPHASQQTEVRQPTCRGTMWHINKFVDENADFVLGVVIIVTLGVMLLALIVYVSGIGAGVRQERKNHKCPEPRKDPVIHVVKHVQPQQPVYQPTYYAPPQPQYFQTPHYPYNGPAMYHP